MVWEWIHILKADIIYKFNISQMQRLKSSDEIMLYRNKLIKAKYGPESIHFTWIMSPANIVLDLSLLHPLWILSIERKNRKNR